jgi:hypothetical protein
VKDPNLCGLHVALEGQADLETGLVEGAQAGVCVSDDFDVRRLERDVSYSNNDVLLDTTSLPVPEPSDDIGNAQIAL